MSEERHPVDQLLDYACEVGSDVINDVKLTGGFDTYMLATSSAMALADNLHREFDRVTMVMQDCNEPDLDRLWQVRVYRGGQMGVGYGASWPLAISAAINDLAAKIRRTTAELN